VLTRFYWRWAVGAVALGVVVLTLVAQIARR
jgi:hypothetical protein